MAAFDPNSRYVKFAKIVEARDRKGRKVQALTPAEIPPQRLLGEHLRKDGQRLDHLAAHYLDDPNGTWRLADINDALLPDTLAEARIVKIPTRR